LCYVCNFFVVADGDNVLPKFISPEILSAMEGVQFIAQHIKDADKDNEVSFRIIQHASNF